MPDQTDQDLRKCLPAKGVGGGKQIRTPLVKMAGEGREAQLSQIQHRSWGEKHTNSSPPPISFAFTGSAKAQDFIARGCAVDNSIFVTNSTLTFGDTSYKLVNVELKEAKNGASRISSYLSFAILLPSVILFLLDRPL